jgi:methylmalonyl-CoA/ethylmalonyl-CoA epimerase
LIKKIDHIGIIVSDLEKAVIFFRCIGAVCSHVEVVESEQIKIVFINIGGVYLELMSPLSDTSAVAKSLEKRGEGLHHICYEVQNIQVALETLKNSGARLIDETPKVGASNSLVAFIHPKSANGVLTELCEKRG